MEPNNLLLDRYLLAQTSAKKPRVCFIPTASADSTEYSLNFYKAFSSLGAIPTVLSLYKPPSADLRSFIFEHDAIYVGGGNTKNLMALWREWELDQILRDAWRQGIVMAGISAGSLCWFEDGITDSIPGPLTPIHCLGFLEGSNCPHYDGEANRRPTFEKFISKGLIKPGFAADDGAALHFVNGKLHRVVSSRPHAFGYRVDRHGARAVEVKLKTHYLGKALARS